MGKELKQLMFELQKIVIATKERGNKMRKLIIRSVLEMEELRAELRAFIENSRFNNNRAGLAAELSKLHPFENWNERKLNYWLTDATNIPMHQLNQLLDFVEPDEKIEYNFNSLQDGLDQCRVQLNDLETALYKSRADNQIDDKEYSLISSHANLIVNKLNKFLTNTRRLVGQTLL